MSKKRQITIVDLAEAAGVSIATVSNVLNRRRVPMSEETIRKVEEAAKRLGYRRNVMAASLSRRRTYELGMIVPGLTGYYGRFAEVMQWAAHEHGYHLSVFSSAGYNPELEQRHLELLLQRRVDGLFSHGLAMSQEATRQIVSDGTPLVLFNGWGWPPDLAAGAANLDFAGAAEQAVTHLYEGGCRRLYYLGRLQALETDRQRRIGFAAGLEKLPGDVRARELEISYGVPEDIPAALEIILSSEERGEGPAGILAFDDFTAFHFLSEVQSRGLRVPEDYRIVGINNDGLASVCWPGLTTLDIDYNEQARLAVGLMLRKLEDPKAEELLGDHYADASGELRIPMKLIVRGSTQPAASR